jgi:hypothetical protein
MALLPLHTLAAEENMLIFFFFLKESHLTLHHIILELLYEITYYK